MTGRITGDPQEYATRELQNGLRDMAGVRGEMY